jgi:hypothetical protein
MTPAQVETYARDRYNAASSTFWSQDVIFKLIYQAELELATECLVIEGEPDTSISTVANTVSYSFPSLCIGIKRVLYDGNKLRPIDFREYDALNLSPSSTAPTGSPQYYAVWNSKLYLYPTPDAAETVTVYPYQEPTLLTTQSTSLSTPVRVHMKLVDYVVAAMAEKDGNYQMADRYRALWEKTKGLEKRLIAKRKRTDGYALVKTEENLPNTMLGVV